MRRRLRFAFPAALLLIALTSACWLANAGPGAKLSLDRWQRHVIDPEKPWRAVFITSGDMNGDKLPDIITGGWWYRNPGTPGGAWTRHDIGDPLKNMAVVHDFDGDGALDVLGTKGEGSDANASFVWGSNDGMGRFVILPHISDADGDFLQGVALACFRKDGPLEIALSWHRADKGIQMLEVPVEPNKAIWEWRKIHDTSQDEALSAGDIDGDGDPDLLLGTIWLRNDGERIADSQWSEHLLNPTSGDPDRNRLADVNGDGRLDAVVGFEAINKPGKLAWYEQGSSPTGAWTEHVIENVIGPMSLDVGDLDNDGDVDVVVGEHYMKDPASARTLVFENADGKGGSWRQHLVSTGDEHHDGAQLVDIDNDGDLDIISLGWSHPRVLLYENKAL